jgi:hypothetical protein
MPLSLRNTIITVLACTLTVVTVYADRFRAYQPIAPTVLPDGTHAIDALPDGRIVALAGVTIYEETGPGSGIFLASGDLPDPDIGEFGAAFLRVDPTGQHIAVGNNGGVDFNQFELGIFDRITLQGQWFSAAHAEALWLDERFLIVSAGEFFVSSQVVLFDTHADPPQPVVLVDNILGGSAGVAIDSTGNLYTGNGFDFSKGGSDTGWIKVFDHAEWSAAWDSGQPLNFELDGQLVADVLSAATLAFDTAGNLIVGGGDFGSNDHGHAALVRGSALKSARETGIPVTEEDYRLIDPEPANPWNFFDVRFNPILSEMWLREAAIVHRLKAPSPFATRLINFDPAPGQFVNVVAFSDGKAALGPPSGAGTTAGQGTDIVSLGGFGGQITLGFDHTVMDHPSNPLGLDAIVFGNAWWIGDNPNRHWAECATIEICRDLNGNGLPDPDELWYVIPGSHLPSNPELEVQCWDDLFEDFTCPPESPEWYPANAPSALETMGYPLPEELFGFPILENPNGLDSDVEGIYGYADYSPTLQLGDTDGDNIIDDPARRAAEFYTIPDDPLVTGISAGSGGGDAFDIAWAMDPATGQPAGLDGFDFIRLTTAGNGIDEPIFGETSTEIDAVADVAASAMHIISSDPPHDAIDARQPHTADDATTMGWDRVTLVLAEPASHVGVDSIEVGVTDGPTPLLTSVTIDETIVTMEFAMPIPAGAWTTITDLNGTATFRLGALPGDVNGDATASAVDILALIDAFNGVAVLPHYSVDIDRNQSTTPLDLLKLIDLLNGAGLFESWNGRMLP